MNVAGLLSVAALPLLWMVCLLVVRIREHRSS